MEYQYKCRITAWDFFRLTMRQTYRSMAGMCIYGGDDPSYGKVLESVGGSPAGSDADRMPAVPGHPAVGNLCESQASGGGCTAGCTAYF